MAKKRIALELGMGSSLRRGDYTSAAKRAVENALWRNSLTVADAFGLPREAMLVDVEVAVQKPEAGLISQSRRIKTVPLSHKSPLWHKRPLSSLLICQPREMPHECRNETPYS